MTDGASTGETFVAEVHVRWGDSDRLGHVNNTLFLEYMQEARVLFMKSLSQGTRPDPREAMVVRRMELEFLRPIKDESSPLAVELSVLSLSTSSFRLRHVIRDSLGAVCGIGDAVLVGFDAIGETKRALTDTERDVLTRHLVVEADSETVAVS
ncbi:acyl-CoA thioesterase [Rhodococcus rhodnii]|uniref:Thioesterase n=2 Tax=Rhodococcus rhodnii TaxID=38312 RepID=R7WMD8_9NOCA|nr:acyl-CoA thioesterase [Rhodococcus rhodnii]EOM76472.1 thioesterase [Rhodococcus rhodnii LMG 5362]TXG91581.1 acyl-CoA thioesterase [Rhodococcus rhodnii]